MGSGKYKGNFNKTFNTDITEGGVHITIKVEPNSEP